MLHHTACDHECNEPLDVRQIRAKAGPGYRPATQNRSSRSAVSAGRSAISR